MRNAWIEIMAIFTRITPPKSSAPPLFGVKILGSLSVRKRNNIFVDYRSYEACHGIGNNHGTSVFVT